jgi:flagellar basal body-associated protein FliL
LTSGAPLVDERPGEDLMDELPRAAPAGWYPGPDGGQRFWDGTTWLAIPAPDVLATQPHREPANEPPRKRNKRAWILAVVAILVLAGLGVGGYLAKNVHDATQAALVAAQDAKSRDDQAAAAKAQTDAAQAEEAADAEQAKEDKAAKDKVERQLRKETVSDIESSVKKMAKGHVKDDVIDGPIVKVSCDPVAGGSVDDLSEKTTVFQCFAANKKNKDGTSTGYYYNATMNWKTGSYTYGLGKS